MNSRLRNLPIDQRIRLIEDLWDSILVDQHALALTDEQKAELDLRLDAYERDGFKGRSAEDVIANLKRRL